MAAAYWGWIVLTATSSCRLSESDVVTRTPDIGHGTGGSGELDASETNSGILDDAASGGFDVDIASEVSKSDGGRTESALLAPGLDTSVDMPSEPSDASVLGESHDPCTAEGYQFCEDFQTGATRWDSTTGTWTVNQDSVDGSSAASFGPSRSAASIAYVPSGAWQDMTVEARVKVTSFAQFSSSNRVVLCARYQDLSHFYGVSLRGDGKLGLRVNATGFGSVANVSVGEDEWHTLKIKVSGPRDNVMVEGYLDGTLLTAATDTSGSLPSAVGTVGLGVYGGAMAVFDAVTVSSP